MHKPLPLWVKFFEGVLIVIGVIALLLALMAIQAKATASPPGDQKGPSKIITSAKTIKFTPEPVIILTQIREPVTQQPAKQPKPAYTPRVLPVTNIPPSEIISRLIRASNAQGWQSEDLLWIVKKESGFRPNAQNKRSSAYGLFQFLNRTWKSYGCVKTSNVDEQIRCGVLYIKKRYGTPTAARAHHNQKGWY